MLARSTTRTSQRRWGRRCTQSTIQAIKINEQIKGTPEALTSHNYRTSYSEVCPQKLIDWTRTDSGIWLEQLLNRSEKVFVPWRRRLQPRTKSSLTRCSLCNRSNNPIRSTHPPSAEPFSVSLTSEAAAEGKDAGLETGGASERNHHVHDGGALVQELHLLLVQWQYSYVGVRGCSRREQLA